MNGKHEQLKSKMDTIYDSYVNSTKDSGCNATCISGKVADTLREYKDIIKDFFSTDDGEGECIKKLYAKSKDYNFAGVKITTPNLKTNKYTYNEYISGMLTFIDNEIANISNTNSMDHQAKLMQFIQKDDDFIESLFGNGTNVQRLEDVDLSSALSNLEVLIEYIPSMTDRVDKLNDIITRLTENGAIDQPVASALVRLYATSTLHYATKLIEGVFSSFVDMCEATKLKASVIIPKSGITNPGVKPTFQLL